MNIKSIRWLAQFSLVGLFWLHGANAEEQAATTPNPNSSAQMGGMQHSMGGMNPAQPSQNAMGGMQHEGMGAGQTGQAGMGGMQHGGMGGGMMGSMSAMTEQQQDEAWKQLQSQDIRLGELRRQMREATDQVVRDKLKAEHRSVLREQLLLTHKLMMQEHMKSMKGSSMSGGQPGQPANP